MFFPIFAKMLNLTKIRLFSVKISNFSICENFSFTQNLAHIIKYDNLQKKNHSTFQLLQKSLPKFSNNFRFCKLILENRKFHTYFHKNFHLPILHVPSAWETLFPVPPQKIENSIHIFIKIFICQYCMSLRRGKPCSLCHLSPQPCYRFCDKTQHHTAFTSLNVASRMPGLRPLHTVLSRPNPTLCSHTHKDYLE